MDRGMELRGKRALITGGARRLGREIALHLSQIGCEVTVHFNRSVAEAESLRAGIQCRLFQADFSSVSIANLTERLEKEVGRIDILISSASDFRRLSWTDVEEKSWDQNIAVNLKVPFFLTQFFGKKMKAHGSGKIIHLADIAAYRPYLKYLPYSVAKAGIVNLTQAFARALAPEVQVNAIAPGTVLFPDDFSAEEQKKIVQKIPAGRTARIEELLRTVDFLLFGIDYITGQTIVLDGGRSLIW